jgi:hypothetical protein
MSEEESTRPVLASAWLVPTFIHGVLALTVFTRLVTAGPRWDAFYEDWKLVRPATTATFVAASLRMDGNLAPVMAALAIALVVDGLVLWLMGGWSRFEGQLWFFVVVAILLITWGVMEVSFFIPYYKLQRALSR